MLTLIDLFAGCGGLSLGLEDAGFRPLLVCELNQHARESYLANRQQYPIAEYSDVLTLTDKELHRLKVEWRKKGVTDVDLVAGGPPCQGYSGIGHRRSYAVEKEEIPSNHLYREMARVISAVNPKMFLFENVKGLLTAKWRAGGEKGEIWRDVLDTFKGIKGYKVESAVLEAKKYGVPQNRPRVLLVGIRDDLSWTPVPELPANGLLPAPIAQPPPNIEELLSDLVDPNYYRNIGCTGQYPHPARTDVQRALRKHPNNGSVARKGDTLTEHEYSRHSTRVRDKFQHMIDSGTIPEELRTRKFAQRVLPRRWDDRGPTITATSLPDDYVHFDQPRILTVREWARLQTFPDWYQFRGPRTTGGMRRAGNPHAGIWTRDVPRYTQIGNAVPVELARRVGKHIAKLLR